MPYLNLHIYIYWIKLKYCIVDTKNSYEQVETKYLYQCCNHHDRCFHWYSNFFFICIIFLFLLFISFGPSFCIIFVPFSSLQISSIPLWICIFRSNYTHGSKIMESDSLQSSSLTTSVFSSFSSSAKSIHYHKCLCLHFITKTFSFPLEGWWNWVSRSVNRAIRFNLTHICLPSTPTLPSLPFQTINGKIITILFI